MEQGMVTLERSDSGALGIGEPQKPGEHVKPKEQSSNGEHEEPNSPHYPY